MFKRPLNCAGEVESAALPGSPESNRVASTSSRATHSAPACALVGFDSVDPCLGGHGLRRQTEECGGTLAPRQAASVGAPVAPALAPRAGARRSACRPTATEASRRISPGLRPSGQVREGRLRPPEAFARQLRPPLAVEPRAPSPRIAHWNPAVQRPAGARLGAADAATRSRPRRPALGASRGRTPPESRVGVLLRTGARRVPRVLQELPCWEGTGPATSWEGSRALSREAPGSPPTSAAASPPPAWAGRARSSGS